MAACPPPDLVWGVEIQGSCHHYGPASGRAEAGHRATSSWTTGGRRGMTKIKDQGSNRGKTSDTADFDCNECHGTGMVKRYIGHEGRGAIFPVPWHSLQSKSAVSEV